MKPMVDQPDPIFIISLPRSGSTLLQRLIMTSGKVITWSETWVLLPFLDMFGMVGFPSTAVYSWSRVKDATRDRVENAEVEEYEIIRKLYRAYVESGNPERRMLDKTPRYYLIAEELLKMFPSSKVLVITRDLNDIVTSIRNTWWGGRLNLYHNWLDLRLGPRLLDSFVNAHLNDSRVLRISYEDLLTDREAIERRLRTFLDLPTIDFSKLGQSSVRGILGDPKNRNSTQINTGLQRSRPTLVQHLLVKHIFGNGTGMYWRRHLPRSSYNPWANLMDLVWVTISFAAIVIKISQLKATMKYPYKWS